MNEERPLKYKLTPVYLKIPPPDRSSCMGKMITAIMFVLGVSLLLLLFAFFGQRRATQLFVAWGNQSMEEMAFEEAKYWYGYALYFDEEYDSALLGRYAARFQRHQFTEALEDIEFYIKLYPDDATGYLKRARLSLEMGESEKALEDISYAEGLSSLDFAEEGQLTWFKVEVLRQLGQLNEALAVLTALLETDASDTQASQALEKRAELYLLLGETSKAGEDYAQWVELEAENPAAYLARGRFYWKELLSLVKAVPDFEQAIALEPTYAEAYADLGLLEYGRDEFEAALPHLEKAREFLPDNAPVLAALARIYNDQARMEECLALLNQALELRPNDPPSLILRGRILFEQGEHKKALDDFTQALMFDNGNESALLGRSDVYQAMADSPLALQDLESVLAQSRQHPGALSRKATLLHAEGQIDEVIAIWEQLKGLQLNERTKWTLKQMKLLESQDRLEEALTLGQLEESLVFDLPNSHITPLWIEISRLFYKSQDFASSLSYYNQVLVREPENGTAFCGRGRAGRQLGNIHIAVAVLDLKKCLELVPEISDGEAIQEWLDKHSVEVTDSE